MDSQAGPRKVRAALHFDVKSPAGGEASMSQPAEERVYVSPSSFIPPFSAAR